MNFQGMYFYFGLFTYCIGFVSQVPVPETAHSWSKNFFTLQKNVCFKFKKYPLEKKTQLEIDINRFTSFSQRKFSTQRFLLNEHSSNQI